MEGSLLPALGGAVFWLATHESGNAMQQGIRHDYGVVAAERCPTRLITTISNAGCPTQLRTFDGNRYADAYTKNRSHNGTYLGSRCDSVSNHNDRIGSVPISVVCSQWLMN